ncbi:MAG: alanine--tRNA ligase [Coriobacteriia bacterium]
MKSADIRESYLSFFESKGCRRWPSSSLLPDDPSLLFTSAGMVQFKPVFLGLKDLGFTRATSVQKCLRTTDIDIIGTTGRHHSFFEMLGNFSFGDYFKSEACAWAWEYSTAVLGLDPARIWISIFEDDDQAEEIWRDEVGVAQDRIVRMGAKDNFWSAGPTGPCGPCSELYYDQGEALGCGLPSCAPGCDCDRYVEYWNLVFMQYDRQEDGTLVPLPKQNIDTGMGLERVAAILQDVPSNFETDDLRAIMTVAEQLTGVSYGTAEKSDTSLRILTDHARAVTFMIADGVLPSNEGRGYVLRRLLRRAVRHARLLGRTEPALAQLIDVVVDRFGSPYPELVERHDLVRRIVDAEETRFGATLRQGLVFLEEEIESLKSERSTVLDGHKAFTLHDTYGFPAELTAEILAEHGMTYDLKTFDVDMEAQRDRARAAVKDDSWTGFGGVFSGLLSTSGATEFVGYERDEGDATVVGIVVDGQLVDRLDPGVVAEIVLDTTPFYGEQGGQVGDIGVLETLSGATFKVSGTKIPVAGLIAHEGSLEAGALVVGESVTASIDVLRRERIRRNHTATHILHWALRRVLGDHVHQSGSYVAPDRLRFDFTHFEAPTADDLIAIEQMVNNKIMENHPVRAYETSLATAKESGVTALFGEKYGEFVRVLEIGFFSKELCGGTHVGRTSELGLLKIVSEGSVGANLRRIEAVTSFDALEYFQQVEAELLQTATLLKVHRTDVVERVRSLQAKLKDAEESVKRASSARVDDGAFEQVQTADGYPLQLGRVGDVSAVGLREVADRMRGESGAVIVVSVADGKVLMVASGAPAAVTSGFDAGAVIRKMAEAIGGRGGGKPAMAQGGGDDASLVDDALAAARALLGVE